MNNFTKILISLGLLVISFTSLAQTKLHIWWVEREQIPMLHEIASEQSDLTIEVRTLNMNELNNEFIKAAATGQNVPDIINVDSPFNAWFADAGLLEQLDSYVEKSSILNMNTFFNGPKSSVVWKDHIYGIPNSTNTIALFYNKDMFTEAGLNPEQPPKTWDELYQYAKKLTDPKKNRYGLFFSAVATEEGTFQILPWIQMAGSNWDNINSAGTIEALNYLKRFLDEGLTSKDALIKTQDPAPFIAKQTAMMITGPWALSDLRKAKELNWGIALLPRNPKYDIGASALGGMNVAIPEKSANKAKAFAFIEEIGKRQNKLWNEVGFLTARTDVVSDTPVHEADVHAVFVEQLNHARARGPHPQWIKISKAITDMYQNVLIGKETPEKAVARAGKAIDRIMKK